MRKGWPRSIHGFDDRRPVRQALQPRWVFLAYWAAVVVATLALHPTSTLDGPTIWLFLWFAVAFTLAVMVATSSGPNAAAPSMQTWAPEHATLNGRVIALAVFSGSAANVLAALLAIRSNSLSISDILTLQGLAESANTMAVARYSQDGASSLIALLLGMGYVAALVAPFARLTDLKGKTLFVLMPAVTSLAYASVSSARLGFLIAASLTAGGIVATVIVRTGRAPLVKPKVVAATILAGALIAGAFIGIGALRIGQATEESLRLSFEKQVVYVVGSTGAFATWYDHYGSGNGEQLGWGTATIAGVEYLTGQERSATRAFDEFSAIDTTGRTSNVYTAFRGLLMDFGIGGTLIFLSVMGFVFGRLSRRAARGRPVAAVIVGFGYATIFLSAWLATTTFTNVLAVLIVAPAVIGFAHNRALSTMANTPAPGTVTANAGT